MSKKERESAQRRKREADPGQPQKSGAAKPTYVSTDKKKKKKSKKNEELYMDLEHIIMEELEEVLDEREVLVCGFGKLTLNQIERRLVEMLREAGEGAMKNPPDFYNLKTGMIQAFYEAYRLHKDEERIDEKKKKKKSGKKDACYHKVKSRYKVWPSAYASGALVKCRKVGAKNWGNSKKENLQIMIEDELSQVLLETHSAEHEKELEKISDELAGASKMHKGQSDRIKKILDQTEDPKDDKVDEAVLTEKCWDGYKQVGMKDKGGKMVPNCVPVEENKDLYKMENCGCGQDPCKTYGDENKVKIKLNKMVQEELQAVLDEKKKKKKPCKPSKGKRFAKRVNGKCRSFGQKGKAKGGGDRIRPGTKKGDAYCARSAKIKKCKNPPCANDLSRKKWKCRGSKSMKE